MAQAARLADPIGHCLTMNWLVRGAIIGAAIGLGAVAIVGTGGLAAVAVVGGLVAGGAGIGEMLSTMSFAAKEVTGAITGPGSPNVFTNSRPAARAHLDMTMCSKHPSAPLPIATGSATVFINGQPAARVDDTIACSAVITAGSGTVFIGGAKQQTDQISPEDLVPPLVHAAMLVVGLGAAVVLAGAVVAVAGFALGTAGGMAGNWAGGKVFGEGSDRQKWTALGGGLVGGMLGGKGASFLAGKFVPRTVTTPGEFASVAPETERIGADTSALESQLADAVATRAESLSTKGADGYLSRSRRGPVLSGVMDPQTGEIFYGLNQGKIPTDLHPLMQQRLDAYLEAIGGITPPRAGIPGSHSEISALDQAIKAREILTGVPIVEPDLSSFLLHNRALIGERSIIGIPPRCANCAVITDGVKVIGGN